MKSTIIELRNQDSEVIKYEAVELEITTPLTVTALPTLYSTIEEASHEANELNKELAKPGSGVSAVEATPADELAAIAARVDGFDERIAALSARVIEVIERAPEEVKPYDDLVDIAARVAGVVSYAPLGEFGEPYEEATTFARNLLADALTQVPAVAEAVSFAEVEAAIATALAEVGISVAIEEEVTYIDSL